jgi:hypothetical protein
VISIDEAFVLFGSFVVTNDELTIGVKIESSVMLEISGFTMVSLRMLNSKRGLSDYLLRRQHNSPTPSQVTVQKRFCFDR